jgi:hypothetical protein
LFQIFFSIFSVIKIAVGCLRLVRLAYQPPASTTFLSEQTSHQQPTNNTFLSEQTITSHQPPAKRTGCLSIFKVADQSASSFDPYIYHTQNDKSELQQHEKFIIKDLYMF